ncbi:NAD-dependent epimerase [Nocardioides baekrokdamisoli]|uniref:NAD-dependent epimerase n=1 Tax=Nocardioides baekrokdamisoli TaxID=1804624 RepID=A0A3G9IMQ4_9ACTN|nr:NmrA family NAD(P)-binding protein [Nocardioides baekrokdamisoli]BBH17295.1 NAD-dependent epimerase [Nocardioides baekrokdamisoli]
MAKIAIFGGTGYAGGHIAREAAERGHTVSVISRSAGADLQGSFADADFVNGVARDHDQIVIATQPDGLLDALPTLLEGARTGGARLSFVGGAGSTLVAEGGPQLVETPTFPAEYKAVALAHGAVLDALRADAKDAEWFYVSPAAAFGAWAEGEKTGSYRVSDDVLITDAEGNSTIGGADYAKAYVDEIENGKHKNKRLHVAY